jgi:hypothetical protein
MKLFTIITLSLLMLSCKALNAPQTTPVKKISDNVYEAECNGLAETMGNCFDKAKKTCQGDFNEIERKEHKSGAFRSIVFSC